MANVSIFQRLVGVAIIIAILCLAVFTYRDGVPNDAGFDSPIAIQTAILFVALIIGIAIFFWGWRGIRWIGAIVGGVGLLVLIASLLAAILFLFGIWDNPLPIFVAALVATPMLVVGDHIFSEKKGLPSLWRLIKVEIGVLAFLTVLWALRFLFDNWRA